MIVRELLTVWGFDIDEKPMKKLEASIATVNNAIKVTAYAGAAAAGILFGLAKSASEVGDQIAKTADKIGFSTDALQELRYAAQNATDLGIGAVDMALQRFSRRAAEAANGTGEAKDALAELGVKLTDSSGKMRSADSILSDVADAMQNVKGEQDRLRLAFKLFDSEGAGMVNLLKDGSAGMAEMRKEAHDLGAVLSERNVRAAEEFDDAMLRTAASVKGIALTIGAELMPEIQSLLDGMTEWIRSNKELLESRIDTALNVLKIIVRSVSDAFWFLVSAVSKVVDAMGGMEHAVRLVGLALLFMASVTVVGAITSLVAMVVRLAGAIKALGFAAIFTSAVFKRTIIGAIFTAALLLGEELYLWFTGKGKTMLGEWLGSWEDVKAKFGGIVDWLDAKWQKFSDFWSESIERGIANLKRIGSWLASPFSAIGDMFGDAELSYTMQPAVASGLSGGYSSNQTVNANVTVNARPGMTQDDITAVRRQAEIGMNDSLARAASRLSTNMPGHLYSSE
jgi:hypothetical protein